MKSFNIALLTDHQRKMMELDKAAALLIYNMRIGKVTLFDIQVAIKEIEPSNRDDFRAMLNKYKNKFNHKDCYEKSYT